MNQIFHVLPIEIAKIKTIIFKALTESRQRLSFLKRIKPKRAKYAVKRADALGFVVGQISAMICFL